MYQYTEEDIAIFNRVFKKETLEGTEFNWISLMCDWVDFSRMTKLTACVATTPVAKRIELKLRKANGK